MLSSLVPDDLSLARLIADLDQEVANKGLRIELSTDFIELERLCAKEADRDDVSVCFSPRQFDFTPASAFWLAGYSADGSLVHTQAMRLENLGGLSLAEHWNQQLRRLYVDMSDHAKLREFCGASTSIRGNVVYHGEMWIAPSFRNNGLAQSLSRLCLAIGLMRWKPDWIYAFVSREVVLSGLAIRKGYLHFEPLAIEWENPPGLFDPDEWLVYVSKLDLCKLVKKRAWERS